VDKQNFFHVKSTPKILLKIIPCISINFIVY